MAMRTMIAPPCPTPYNQRRSSPDGAPRLRRTAGGEPGGIIEPGGEGEEKPGEPSGKGEGGEGEAPTGGERGIEPGGGAEGRREGEPGGEGDGRPGEGVDTGRREGGKKPKGGDAGGESGGGAEGNGEDEPEKGAEEEEIGKVGEDTIEGDRN